MNPNGTTCKAWSQVGREHCYAHDPRRDECLRCRGKGELDGPEGGWITCGVCNGTGRMAPPQGPGCT
jgi:hypothetical protein